jgi:hypothetical protein
LKIDMHQLEVASRTTWLMLMLVTIFLPMSSWTYQITPINSVTGEEQAYGGWVAEPREVALKFTKILPQNSQVSIHAQPELPAPKPASSRVEPPLGGATDLSTAQPSQSTSFKVFSDYKVTNVPSRFISTINEPSVANNNTLVFYTGNWYAARSNDGGATWTFVDAYQDMPDLCCDQDVIFDHTRGIFVWYRQGLKGSDGENRMLISVSTDLINWWQYNWKPSTNFSPGFPNQWFDYPHLALSNNFLYITTNIFDQTDSYKQSILIRIPLDQLKNRDAVSFLYWSTTLGTITPVQGATTTIYYATHESYSSLRIWRLQETSTTVQFFSRSIPTWTPMDEGTLCPGPDGTNFCGRADDRVMTGWVAAGKVGFFWNAGAGSGFPYPYINAATFSETDLQYLSRPYIWNENYAWLYPHASPNLRGHLALTAFFGGGNKHPSVVALIDDDLNGDAPPWESYTLTQGTAGPSSPKWGDYLRTRQYGGSSNGWIATGFTVQGGAIEPRLYVYGRERDNPILPIIRFELNGFASRPNLSILRIDGTNYSYSQFPLSFSWQPGSSHSIQAYTPVASDTSSTRFVWKSWTNGGTLTASSGTYITPSSAQTAAANYQTQHLLSVIGGDSISYIDAATSDGWYNANAASQVTTKRTWNFIAGQSRENLVSWSLDGGLTQPLSRAASGDFTTQSIVMDRPHTITFNSIIQYFFSVEGGVNIAYSSSSQTKDEWFDKGTATQVQSSYVFQEVTEQSRQNLISYTLDGVTTQVARASAGSMGPTITFDKSHALKFNYLTQVYLKISGGNNIGLSTPSPTADNWFDKGQSTKVSTDRIWDQREGSSRKALDEWQLDSGQRVRVPRESSTFATPSISMNDPRTVTFYEVQQFFLSIDSGGGTLDKSSNWYDEGESVTISALSLSNVVTNQSRLVFTGWSGSITSNKTTITVKLDTYKSIGANWKTQYYVRVITSLAQATGEGWYDEGSTATVSVSPTSIGFLLPQVFQGWEGDIKSSNSEVIFQVSSPKLLQAKWGTDYTQLIILAGIVIAILVSMIWLRKTRRMT